MRTLLLLRHAKSAWPDGVDDHDRPLAERGRAAAPLVGRHLRDAGVRIDRALVSSARRTRETWALVSAELSPSPAMAVAPAIYQASTQALLELIRREAAGTETLMLVGHNPGTADLAALLTDPAASDEDALARLRRKVPTAALATLTFPGEDWRVLPAACVLESFVTPRMLGGVDED